MRSRRRLTVTLTILLSLNFAATLIGTSPADAACVDGQETYLDPVTGKIKTRVCDSGDPGGSTTSPTGPTACVRSTGEVIPCSLGSGRWSPVHDCYLFVTEQPDASDPRWATADGSPEAGRFHTCDDDPQLWIYIANGAEAPPDPAVLAQDALGAVQLTTPTLQLAPAPPAKSYVGLETWMWMPEGQWAPLTNTVTAGSTSVTVTIEPRWVTWNMGPGSKVCYDAGRPWQIGQMPPGSATSCSYTYARVSDFQPGGVWSVSAAITWRVSWTCAGNCLATAGSLGEVDGPAGIASLVVAERQSVNVLPDETRNR
ncbi:hypothetical protein [Aeromicrobium alkaliterrae]|uniref:ATP/GTP-binding protein n=1 Tax=Aeromicrobium alkaliterrae TaxID=302168 RepID=A0ABN2KE45_9ACTN